jgi:hypothetical protein
MILVFAIVFVVVLGWLMWHGRVSSPMARLERELERLQKAGEPTRWEDIAPPVPKHLDGTPLLLKAVEQLHAAQQKFLPNVWKTYNAQVLEAARPALKTFRQALAFPYWRLVDPKQVAEFETPDEEYKALREFARLLSAEAEGQCGWSIGKLPNHPETLSAYGRRAVSHCLPCPEDNF